MTHSWSLLELSWLPLLFLAGCSGSQNKSPHVYTERLSDAHDQITQISVINSLMLGQYDGAVPFETFLKAGNFGLGTLDRLDGELIVLDGKGYQARGDGSVVRVPRDNRIPFAVITPFETDGEFPCAAADSLHSLESILDGAIQHPNNFVAVRVEATLASITIRSVQGQTKPYRPLSETVESQSVWTHDNLDGTFVGIRSPAWVAGLTVPGYHWHFLSADKSIGGHVLACDIRAGIVRYDICGEWTILLEQSEEFNRTAVGNDLREEVRKVESLREENNSRAIEVL